ncbi:Hypothetical predicted protein [Octopus vulgaris]|uniref:Uncharacterized protein n=1 Tax=Octopus vulgaris TaxID=6645 RepID=A0AA36EXJ3_OCTVU|nr:Hypothetical predicted protein [Octopus vulgaris]
MAKRRKSGKWRLEVSGFERMFRKGVTKDEHEENTICDKRIAEHKRNDGIATDQSKMHYTLQKKRSKLYQKCIHKTAT